MDYLNRAVAHFFVVKKMFLGECVDDNITYMIMQVNLLMQE